MNVSHTLLNESNESVVSIRIKNKHFSEKTSQHVVLHDVSLDIKKHECVAILGSSGFGKTTLLRIIAGLDCDYEGSVLHDGQLVTKPSRAIGIVFQESRLLPWFTVQRNIAFALPDNIPENEHKQRIDDVLGLVDLHKFQNYWPHKLSGGMLKRAALARALVNIPDVLLLDEPFTGLDIHAKHNLQEEVVKVQNSTGITTIIVTHDIEEAVYLADRIVIMGGTSSTIKTIINISLPKPRNRMSEEFKSLISNVYLSFLS